MEASPARPRVDTAGRRAVIPGCTGARRPLTPSGGRPCPSRSAVSLEDTLGAGVFGLLFADWRAAQAAAIETVCHGGDTGHGPARDLHERFGFRGLPLVRYYRRL
ncbi:MAG: hypothetical protein AVDCRST_MAG38-2158 [uncultured Solirubrobacteraceae bacterium]|uniref:N-acetyltransferase domain-containing protein n=1 Tax=uncultured Solirubrobacteraceae bacterium TaxID=1162706 RepID=A0A6J4RVP9_9ACTN|nr:MAG: hypothetical protein AVDCRST_MAG38-2158 [uncultured Solirubrobacteraceae bacterium]